jgi:leucyl aminopeptidase
MDFEFKALTTGGLAAVQAGALLVVVGGTAVPRALDKPLAALLDDAVAQGDFEFKANRCLYIHRPAGLAAQRLLLVAAGDASAKAFKAALAAGLATLKAAGIADLAVARVGFDAALDESHARALVQVAGDALYVYRHTKPSAPPALRLNKFALWGPATSRAALAKGLQRGQAVASGVRLARECANRPGNHATPSHLASEAKKIGKEFGIKVVSSSCATKARRRARRRSCSSARASRSIPAASR